MISKNNALLAVSSVLCSIMMILFLKGYTPKPVPQEVAQPAPQPVVVVNTSNYEQLCQERTVWATEALKSVYKMDEVRANTVAPMIAYASVIEGVPVEILLSIIKVESSFKEHATDGKSIGYTQVKPSSWKNEIPYNINNPQGNILAGAYVLKRYYLQTGNWSNAVRAYNVGITAFNKGTKKEVANVYHKKVYSEMKLILTQR